MLRVGQTLWAINTQTHEEDTVVVAEVTQTHFVVEYHGKRGRYLISEINRRFFLEPQRGEMPAKTKPLSANCGLEPSCKNCFYQVSGDCGSLSNIPCEDYRAKVVIPKEESDNWPKYGDALAYRWNDYKHFK